MRQQIERSPKYIKERAASMCNITDHYENANEAAGMTAVQHKERIYVLMSAEKL